MAVNKLPPCDCLNYCGDDSERIKLGLVEPCTLGKKRIREEQFVNQFRPIAAKAMNRRGINEDDWNCELKLIEKLLEELEVQHRILRDNGH